MNLACDVTGDSSLLKANPNRGLFGDPYVVQAPRLGPDEVGICHMLTNIIIRTQYACLSFHNLARFYLKNPWKAFTYAS